MMGFKFGDKHSSEFGIIMKSVNRSPLPALRKRNMEIPGKHGVYDFGGNTYEVRSIQIEISFVERSLNDMRLKIRDIVKWLSAKDKLVFDDEPDKYYIARLYSALSLEQLAASGKIPLTFECEPFARSDITERFFHITESPQEERFVYKGTQETGSRLIVKYSENYPDPSYPIYNIKILLGGIDE